VQTRSLALPCTGQVRRGDLLTSETSEARVAAVISAYGRRVRPSCKPPCPPRPGWSDARARNEYHVQGPPRRGSSCTSAGRDFSTQ
jgi:hypothetical protein